MTRTHVPLRATDFEAAFGDTLSPRLKATIDAANLYYLTLTPEERDECLLKIVKFLTSDEAVKAGKHRREQWERGWGENLAQFALEKQASALLPRYFGKYEVIRWRQMLVKAPNKELEVEMLGVVVEWLLEKYMGESPAIYEFGCGTGHNLLRARRVNATAELYGLDWAESSQKVIEMMRATGTLDRVQGRRFDFFEPDTSFIMTPGSGAYTVAALEQVGGEYERFVEYLIANKVGVCVNIEPIAELLDENNLLDYCAIAYFKKRNYLTGYLDYLKKLEREGRIVIHAMQRSYVGSLFVDGHSIVAWSPR